MTPNLPPKALEALDMLRAILNGDRDPHSGRLWSYVYETGEPWIRVLAEEAYRLSLWRNMLDPTVFPSVSIMERDLVGFVSKLFKAPESSVGNYTSGGTESNFMAVLAAREEYYRRHGRSSVPTLVAPSTVHPSVIKAAWILGLKPVLTPVDEYYRADVDSLQEKIDDKTGIVVLSSPNYPFGTFDPVRDIAESVRDKAWVHVDSYLGFAVPFAVMNGENIPLQGLNVEWVDSMSVDIHKMGYAPRGSSVILYRDRDRRKGGMFVYSRWPGYPLVNQVFLSSRTPGALATSWVLMKALGVDGYRELARRAFNAREVLISAMKENGFKLEGDPPYLVLAFSHPGLDLVDFAAKAGEKGWHIQVQPGSRRLGYPMTVHFTVTPVHSRVVGKFKEDLPGIVSATPGARSLDGDALLEAMKTLKPGEAAGAARMVVEALRAGEGLGGADLGFISRYIYELDPDVVEELFREAANLLL